MWEEVSLYNIRERYEFMGKGIHEDVANLRYKHYQARLIDTLNLVLHERRKLSRILSSYRNGWTQEAAESRPLAGISSIATSQCE